MKKPRRHVPTYNIIFERHFQSVRICGDGPYWFSPSVGDFCFRFTRITRKRYSLHPRAPVNCFGTGVKNPRVLRQTSTFIRKRIRNDVCWNGQCERNVRQNRFDARNNSTNATCAGARKPTAIGGIRWKVRARRELWRPRAVFDAPGRFYYFSLVFMLYLFRLFTFTTLDITKSYPRTFTTRRYTAVISKYRLQCLAIRP